jgi:hypothetical protein
MLLDPSSGSFGYFAGLFYVVAAATAWGLRRGQRPVGWITLWWAGLLLAFNFAPLDASFRWPLFHHFARTLHPLLIPFVLAAALWLCLGLAGRPVVRSSIVVAVTALAAVGIVVTHRDYRSWAIVARWAAPVIATLPAEARVVTDTVTASQLRFLLPARRERIVPYSGGRVGDEGGPVFVLADPASPAAVSPPHPGSASAIPPPSPSWRPVAQFVREPRPSIRGTLRRWLTRSHPESTPIVAGLWRVDG